MRDVIVEIKNISKRFEIGNLTIDALSNVSLEIYKGEILWPLRCKWRG